MGLFDSLLGKKEPEPKIPFKMELSFKPFRVRSRENNTVDLVIELENLKHDPLLASLVVSVSKNLGLDSTCLHKKKEIRLGELKPGEKKEVYVTIYANTTTPQGEHAVGAAAYAHYRSYDNVLDSIKKITQLRAV